LKKKKNEEEEAAFFVCGWLSSSSCVFPFVLRWSRVYVHVAAIV
jgi:hypothetical protein